MKAANSYPLGMPLAVLRALLLRLLMLLVFGGSIGLIWWSVNRLRPLEKKIETRTGQVATTENDILQLELRWDPAAARATEVRFQGANGRLFSDPEEFTHWQEELQRAHADLFRMAFVTQVVRTQASPLPNKVFSATATTIELQSTLDDKALVSPYQRLVELAQTLTTHTKRVDLLELNATGQSNSVNHAKLRVEVWSQTDQVAR